MAWTLRFTETALKQLKKLDRQTSDLITRALDEKIAKSPDPHLFGKALTGEFKGYWRYRIGDYRVICELREKELIILVIALGHRREIYKRK